MKEERTTRYGGTLWGLRYEVEACPEGSQREVNTTTAIFGAGGFGIGSLLGWSLPGRILAAVAGAGLGNLASRYHVYLDWDPDRARQTSFFNERPDGPGLGDLNVDDDRRR